jgi:hypothetical protein
LLADATMEELEARKGVSVSAFLDARFARFRGSDHIPTVRLSDAAPHIASAAAGDDGRYLLVSGVGCSTRRARHDHRDCESDAEQHYRERRTMRLVGDMVELCAQLIRSRLTTPPRRS